MKNIFKNESVKDVGMHGILIPALGAVVSTIIGFKVQKALAKAELEKQHEEPVETVSEEKVEIVDIDDLES